MKQDFLLKSPIIIKDSPKKAYEITKTINDLLNKEVDPEIINRELCKLKKYSYELYIQENIKSLKINPKKYHQCIQNIIAWNIELGKNTAIDKQSDLDPS